ncbi:DUF4956 domain-containing protein [Williamwhitmania taraxaci]|uniref:DUF4956 domain-containing protein n=1 Tax=Williamwhitmania taraxaci TaxID=1640674 RepID=A0A1G6GMN6_9BACT|nr:DUF4956 domain-containing protein [Williamwhitmania taraxaci]SDB83218.1 protein of unknown function [Williamwhitmania taraxaci]
METLLSMVLPTELFGIKLFEFNDFYTLLIKLAITLTMLIVVIRYMYYPTNRRQDYFFTFFIIGFLTFLMSYLLSSVKLQLGFALGLFAVFGIIRYRTNPIPIREMTYLFLVIALSLINAIANKKVSYAELLFSNVAILCVTYTLETIWRNSHENQKEVIYEKINLIHPEKRGELLEDLRNRTGLNVVRVSIGNIDFMRDIAKITIFYDGNEQQHIQEESGADQDDD